MDVTYWIENQGIFGAGGANWNDSIYLSRDELWDGDDVRLGLEPHLSSLGVGQTDQSSIDVTLPLQAEGSYYLIVLADSLDGVYELDETNNVGVCATPLEVIQTPPDLVVTATTAPALASAGGAVRVTWTVANQGEGNTITSRWKDVVYLSTDQTFDPADKVLATFDSGSDLAMGETYQRSELVQLPWDLSGSYTLFVVTDGARSYGAAAAGVRGRARQQQYRPSCGCAHRTTPGRPDRHRGHSRRPGRVWRSDLRAMDGDQPGTGTGRRVLLDRHGPVDRRDQSGVVTHPRNGRWPGGRWT